VPPKEVRPMAAAAAKKPTATTEMTLPVPRPPLNFSVDSTDKFADAYYCNSTQDFADMVIHINGVLDVSEYHMSIAQDRMFVSWQRSVKLVCYTKEILAGIMGNAYSPSNHCIIAYDNIAQEIFAKKIRPNNKLIWGAPQVMCIKWKCTGTPTIFKHDYPIDYVAVDLNVRRNRQQNTIIIIKLKKVKERTAVAEVGIRQLDIFGAFSQGSSNLTPPPCNARRGLTREKDTRWTTTPTMAMTTIVTTTAATGEGGGEGEVDAEWEREGRRGRGSPHHSN
jgi:hypothetical protein